MKTIINNYFFKFIELENTRYFKHKLVMLIARDLNWPGNSEPVSLKEAWRLVNAYFNNELESGFEVPAEPIKVYI